MTRTGSKTQTYQIKSVFSTDYLDMPVITASSAQSLTVPPAVTGATPPTQTLAASLFTVSYAFKAGTADPLGNTPPIVVPVPYTNFASADLVKGQASLGSTTLSTPQGVLNIQGTGVSGNLSSGSITFTCDAWTLAKQGTSVTKTLSFANSVVSGLASTFAVTCVYQQSVPPSFASALTNAVLTSGVASTWTLPAVTSGSFAYSSVAMTAAADIASFLSFTAATRTVSYNGNAYAAALTSSSVSFVLTDAEGGTSASMTQALDLQPVECGQALGSKVDATATIVLIKEYEPTIYFPEKLFTGPHTHTGYSCRGTYTQSVAIDSAVTGVTVVSTPDAGDSDKRPRVSVGSTTSATTTFTLTFSATFTF